MLNKFMLIQSMIPHFSQLLSALKAVKSFVEQTNSQMCEIEVKANGKEVKVKGRNPEELEKLVQLVKNLTN